MLGLEKDIGKKQKAHAELEKWMLSEEHLKSYSRAHELQQSGGKPSEVQKAFEEAKKSKIKYQKTEERLVVLREEILKLQNQLASLQSSSHLDESSLESAPAKKQNSESRLASFEWQILNSDKPGKKWVLGENIWMQVGRNAAENLQILRSAQSWDYWIHLKDYPSSHAIIHRNKNTELPRTLVIEAARRIVDYHRLFKDQKGLKLEVIFAECRYVKPVKGAKPGTVTHQKSQTLTFIT